MGRRNGASKARDRRRRPQVPKRVTGLPTTRPRGDAPPPIPLSKMVLPSGRCGRKLIFLTEADAKRALKQARQARRRQGSAYIEGRIYHHPTCGGWHLTSLEYAKNEDTK